MKKEVNESVLYQKMFNKWYAITEVNGECLFTEVNVDPFENKIELINVKESFEEEVA